MVSIVVSIMIIMCCGACLYKLCTCCSCGSWWKCSSCCRKKHRDGTPEFDSGFEPTSSLESVRPPMVEGAPGNSKTKLSVQYRPKNPREKFSRPVLSHQNSFRRRTFKPKPFYYGGYGPRPRREVRADGDLPSPKSQRSVVLDPTATLTRRDGVIGSTKFEVKVPSGQAVTDLHGNLYNLQSLDHRLNANASLALNQSRISLNDPVQPAVTEYNCDLNDKDCNRVWKRQNFRGINESQTDLRNDSASLAAPPSSRAESLLAFDALLDGAMAKKK